MFRSFLLLTCLFSLSACGSWAAVSDTELAPASSADEKAATDAILGSVRTAIAANDFASLSKMDDEFRLSRARTPSGVWKLAAFHAGLQFFLAEGLQQKDGCQYRRANFVRQWAAASPRNPAPVITDAALLLAQAWCFRGGGYAQTVAADAWPKFRAGVTAAYQTLEQHRAAAAIDPEFYAVKLDMLRVMGLSKEAFRDALDEATEQEPDYHRTYFNAAAFYLPQWGGSFAEVEQFARYAAERTHSSEQGGLYARVFWFLDECGCQIVQQAADWSTMRQAMRDVYNRYPVAWNRKYFASLSCRTGHIEEGQAYIKAAHPELTDAASFALQFGLCDEQARSGS